MGEIVTIGVRVIVGVIVTVGVTVIVGGNMEAAVIVLVGTAVIVTVSVGVQAAMSKRKMPFRKKTVATLCLHILSFSFSFASNNVLLSTIP